MIEHIGKDFHRGKIRLFPLISKSEEPKNIIKKEAFLLS